MEMLLRGGFVIDGQTQYARLPQFFGLQNLLSRWRAEARWCWECVRPCVSEHSWSSQLFWAELRRDLLPVPSWGLAGPSFGSVICRHPSSPPEVLSLHHVSLASSLRFCPRGLEAEVVTSVLFYGTVGGG